MVRTGSSLTTHHSDTAISLLIIYSTGSFTSLLHTVTNVIFC